MQSDNSHLTVWILHLIDAEVVHKAIGREILHVMEILLKIQCILPAVK